MILWESYRAQCDLQIRGDLLGQLCGCTVEEGRCTEESRGLMLSDPLRPCERSNHGSSSHKPKRGLATACAGQIPLDAASFRAAFPYSWRGSLENWAECCLCRGYGGKGGGRSDMEPSREELEVECLVRGRLVGLRRQRHAVRVVGKARPLVRHLPAVFLAACLSPRTRRSEVGQPWSHCAAIVRSRKASHCRLASNSSVAYALRCIVNPHEFRKGQDDC